MNFLKPDFSDHYHKNGVLAEEINEIIIPFTLEKLQRDLKYFKIDTIRMALTLFEKLGLATTNNEGIFKLNFFEEMVGSETVAVVRKCLERERKLEIKAGGQKVDIVHQ